MKQKNLPELLARERVTAIHWLRWAEFEMPLYPHRGKVKSKEVACGHPLDEQGFRTRATEDRKLVTCRDCYAILHERPPSR